ncbi:uncharacterized protein LOC132949133 [Metopolophium dirhodum]|uniref:uncharacterized protein LOC132949133 n=1 Tax=Metopolophium dirhodum TaxID=44670 RepID=UPI0029905D78|nr:uncharacterized protein LOC132949133 [Metopolophium dirhodum]
MSVVTVLVLLVSIIVLVERCASLNDKNDLLGNVNVPAGATKTENSGFWDPLNLPKSFDARAKWYMCPSIGQIYDQGNCKSSYAISVASAISDRICIHSNGTVKPKLSAQQILSCCYLCGYGCSGGKHFESWDFYRRHGLVSGGEYGSNEGCQPYTIEPCQHTETAEENACSNKTLFTPECKVQCYNPDYGTRYVKDNHQGTHYRVPGYTAMKEIYENGPITASFYMYQDFVNYQSGVYAYNSGKYVTTQAVKILGWGEENGTPYWLAANSFNTYWGDNGFVKILRGANECYIEEFMYAGLPLRHLKMNIVLLLVSSFWLTCNANDKLHNIVTHVNSANVAWQAGINSFHTNDHKKLVGTFYHPEWIGLEHETFDGVPVKGGDCDNDNEDDGGDANETPETFDARYHWFNCTSISHIWNQGNCAADWAISVTSAMNDRICIASQGNITALYSPQKLVSCCEDCGNGCSGGYTAAAWRYILKKGIVTGGDYGSNEGCQPWLVQPCNASTTAADPSSVLGPHGVCGGDPATTPKCDLSCYNARHEGKYLDDIIKAKKVFTFDGCAARKNLRKHGPYVVTMRVYEDFLTYKSGVYHHVTGDYLGLLSVRMIGWGLEGVHAYWLLANSWGTSWGDKGFFKIRRFVNECWIENFRYAGVPKL